MIIVPMSTVEHSDSWENISIRQFDDACTLIERITHRLIKTYNYFLTVCIIDFFGAWNFNSLRTSFQLRLTVTAFYFSDLVFVLFSASAVQYAPGHWTASQSIEFYSLITAGDCSLHRCHSQSDHSTAGSGGFRGGGAGGGGGGGAHGPPSPTLQNSPSCLE